MGWILCMGPDWLANSQSRQSANEASLWLRILDTFRRRHIAALRQAEDNFLHGEVEDGRDEAPPDDEPFVPEISNYEQNVQPEPVLDMYRLPEAVAGAQRSAQGSEYGPSRRPSIRRRRQVPVLTLMSKEAIPREEQASGSDAKRSSKASTSRSETDQRSKSKDLPWTVSPRTARRRNV